MKLLKYQVCSACAALMLVVFSGSFLLLRQPEVWGPLHGGMHKPPGHSRPNHGGVAGEEKWTRLAVQASMSVRWRSSKTLKVFCSRLVQLIGLACRLG